MPEDNEKVENFISLWRKKMETEIKQPSAIRETLERIEAVEQENEELRKKIKENIELISRTEEIVKSILEENKRLKEGVHQAGTSGSISVSEKQEINMLNNKIISLEKNLAEKEVELRAKYNEKIELKTKLEVASRTEQTSDRSTTEPESDVTTELIDNLQSELSKKRAHIDEQERKIKALTEENEALNEQLIKKMKKLPIDYVVPIEPPKSSIIRPQSTQPSSQTLEILCQDLQSDLNKYKRIVEKLNKEKTELKQTIEYKGFKLEPEEIKELKNENEELKNELLQLQESIKRKPQEIALDPQISEAENKINDLQKQLIEKDHKISELKTQQQSEPIIHEGPMSGLIEDLKSKINKLKITIEEKNKIIEELKSS
jgi:chromosome segregation ATPase